VRQTPTLEQEPPGSTPTWDSRMRKRAAGGFGRARLRRSGRHRRGQRRSGTSACENGRRGASGAPDADARAGTAGVNPELGPAHAKTGARGFPRLSRVSAETPARAEPAPLGPSRRFALPRKGRLDPHEIRPASSRRASRRPAGSRTSDLSTTHPLSTSPTHPHSCLERSPQPPALPRFRRNAGLGQGSICRPARSIAPLRKCRPGPSH